MDLSAFRKAPLAVALMLGCAAAPAHAGWFSSDPKPAAQTGDKATDDKNAAPASTLEDSIQQAQLLRLAGQYPEAIKHLSQLMMIASDNERVISEYGKTLTAMGRASDAVSFLTRAQQLQPGDWTIYSAMGVAYDQIGDQKSAQAAYEHALSIKPDEPSVLNNYALSRMLAKDPDMARKLAARAENAGGTGDAKIMRNIAMIRSFAPETPAPVAHAPQPASMSVAGNAAPIKVGPLKAPDAHANNVVMQPMPADPLAGPVRAKAGAVQVATKPADSTQVATQAPRSLQPNATLAAPVKTAETKPAPVVADSGKTVTKVNLPALASAAEAKPVKAPAPDKAGPSVTLNMAAPAPVKAAEADKPVPMPKVLPAKAATKDAVPGLRMSANAY